MVIPVVWASRHEAVLARGTWDHGMLEAWLAEDWPGRQPVEHHEVVGDGPWPEAEAAVVVVSGRNHTTQADLEWLKAHLAAYGRVWLVATGDEAGEFPAARLRHPELVTWHMGAKPDARRVAMPLGSGWPGHYPGLLPVEVPDKNLDLALAGQDTHARRHQAFDALEARGGPFCSVRTESFTAGLDPGEYAAMMADARIVPCPSGPLSPDSFRAYEALEAGAIPLLDARTPIGPEPGYWSWVLGPHPCPEVSDWRELDAIVEPLLEAWPASANRVQAWWLGWRRAMSRRVADELGRLGGPVHLDGAEQITVVVTSSPAPLHPSTEHLEAVLVSIRAHLPEAEIIVGFDGVRPEDAHRADDYHEYVRRALWKCAREWDRVVPVVAPEWEHQANLTRRLLELVATPVVLFVEHDTPLVVEREVDWSGIVAALHSGRVQVMRLHHEAEVHPDHEHLMIDRRGLEHRPADVPALRTVQWSQRPHLARTRWYRDVLARYFAPEARTMIEDVLHGIVESAWLDASLEGWEDWRLWLYAPDGSMQRSTHLDSRGGAPKHTMRFVYPGPPPPGAPQPGKR